MPYFEELLARAFSDTWKLVVARSAPSVIIGLCIFVGTLFFKRYRNRHAEVKTKLTDWVEAGILTLCVFALVFCFNVLIWTPKTIVEEARQQLAESKASALQTHEQEELAQLRLQLKQFRDQAAEEAIQEWPPLTDDQITQLAKALASHQIPEIKVAWGRRVRADKFFRSLQAVGKKLPGCKVQYFEGAFTDDPEIDIVTSKNNPAGDVFFSLFKTLHWPVKLEHYPSDANAGSDAALVEIFIPEKPSDLGAVPKR